MSKCCPPPINCLDCPIVVSCEHDLVLLPGQLQFCPNDCKFYFNCAGQKLCLNPTYGLGLGVSTNCILQVRLDPNSALVFNPSGEISIDCNKLIQCCQLVTQAQLAMTVTQIYNYITGAIAAIPKPKKCGGAELTGSDIVFTAGSLLDANGVAIPCSDRLWTANDILKCDGTPLSPSDRVVTCDTLPPSSRVWFGEVAESASLCIGVIVSSTTSPWNMAMWQARDKVFLAGSGASGGLIAGTYLAKTITNPSTLPSLLEVELRPICNFYETTRNTEAQVTFIHNLGTSLNVAPAGFGQNNTTVYPGWVWNTIRYGGANSSPYINNVDYSGWEYIQESSPPAVFRKLLAPGETITVYGQWWATFNMPAQYSIHGGAKLQYKLTENGIAYV